MRSFLLGIAAISLIVTSAPVRALDQPLDIGGAWKLNRDLSGLPEQGTAERAPGERRPGGGGRGGGRGGFGGFGGFGGGNGQPSESKMHQMEVLRRRLTEISERLIVVHDGNNVSITNENRLHIAYKADGKKQQQVTGDGEFKTKSHFDGAKLVVEEDFGGPKVTTTYTPVLDGGEIRRLEVTLAIEGGGGGGGGSRPDRPAPPPLKRVYDSEAVAR